MADVDFRIKNGLVVDNGSISVANTSQQITVGSTVVNSSVVSATSLVGSGASITSINAASISTGTLDNARLPSAISVTSFTGNGSTITSVNAATVGGNTAGTLRIYTDTAYTNAVSVASSDATTKAGAAYTNATSYADTKAGTAYSNAVSYARNASNIDQGTLNNGRLPASINVTNLAGNGASVTSVNATQLNSKVEANFNVNAATYATYLNGKTEGNLNVNSATYATYATYINNESYNMRLHYTSQSGQPTYLWGTNNGADAYVWNPSNFNVNYASTAGSAPASDVYSWAKQSSKPSYNFSEISSSTISATTGSFSSWVRAAGDVTAFYSDRRLKTNVLPIESALDKIKALNGITYNPNSLAASFGYNIEDKIVGLFADEVEAVQPEAVKLAPFDTNEQGLSKTGQNYKTVQYEKLVPLLIEAIKELNAKVEQLTKERL